MKNSTGWIAMRYTLLRFLLIAMVGGIIWLLGIRDIWWVILTFSISMMLSFILLRTQRAAFGQRLSDIKSGKADDEDDTFEQQAD